MADEAGDGTDWDAVARAHADTIGREPMLASGPPERRRGAVRLSPGVCLAYAADGFAADERGRLEVTLLRQALDDAGLPELGFGVSGDGRAWALLVRIDDAGALHAAALDAWRIAWW